MALGLRQWGVFSLTFERMESSCCRSVSSLLWKVYNFFRAVRG